MKPEIRVERIIDAPAASVFEAWTTVEGMQASWGPGGFTTTYAEIDLRPGGYYLLVMQPPVGEPFQLRGTYRQVIVPRLLAYTWQWTAEYPTAASPLSPSPSKTSATPPMSSLPTAGSPMTTP
jgi:uncharacterized protein YndB with AHSA1/START domain